MNALVPPFPTNPTLGQRYGDWVWNGVQWICAPTTGIQVLTTVLTASGPYMPSPGLVSVVVECVGGGGAGGGALVTNVQYALGGGGGGAGAYARKTLPAALVAGGVAVTIGAGGEGVAAAAGNPGGDTTFGVLCVANGGEGGNVNNAPIGWGAPGLGGAGGTGDLVSGGEPGGVGFTDLGGLGQQQVIFGGAGGSGPWGGGGEAVYAGGGSYAAGHGGAGPGSGGSGGIFNTSAGGATGGPGADGVCVVTEYCWATATGDDQCMNPAVNVNARVAVQQVPWQGQPQPCPPGYGEYSEE